MFAQDNTNSRDLTLFFYTVNILVNYVIFFNYQIPQVRITPSFLKFLVAKCSYWHPIQWHAPKVQHHKLCLGNKILNPTTVPFLVNHKWGRCYSIPYLTGMRIVSPCSWWRASHYRFCLGIRFPTELFSVSIKANRITKLVWIHMSFCCSDTIRNALGMAVRKRDTRCKSNIYHLPPVILQTLR